MRYSKFELRSRRRREDGLRVVLMGLALALAAFGGAAGEAIRVADVPKSPFDLRVKRHFEGAMAVAQLTWRDQSDDEIGFEILRSDDAGKEFKVIGQTGTNTAHYDDKVGRYVTGAYQYQVRAFNEAGRSQPSNVAGVFF